MTSHYMECTVKSPFKDVFHALGEYFGNVYAKEFGKKGENHIGVVLGEEYFFRVNSAAAVMIILGALTERNWTADNLLCWRFRVTRTLVQRSLSIRPQRERHPSRLRVQG